MRVSLYKLIAYLLVPVAAFAKPPSLTEHDTKVKIEEILRAHACYHILNKDLMKRSFQNFIDEMDPLKIYLLESEISLWVNPSEELLEEALVEYANGKFTKFEKMHELMIAAIDRRQRLEKSIEDSKLPEKVEFIDFKDLKYPANEDELFERLVKARALLIETGKKFDAENLDVFMQRVNKRRMNHEQDFLGQSSAERKQIALTYALKALSSSLDSQTNYLTPSEANQFLIQVQQRLFGIGAQLRDEINGLNIVKLLEGSPASRSGKLKEGDKIIAVDNQSIVGMDISEAVELIRGQEGTPVSLTILRMNEASENKEPEKFSIEIVRGEVVFKEMRIETFEEPFGDGIIGVLHLYSFYQDNKTSSANDLLEEINKMKKDGRLKGIVLDLRGNGGGLLTQAVEVTGLFISKGVVVSVKDNTGQILHLRNIDGKLAWEGPLIVLTNRASASAAEIVAQTLQDYGRAIVVGDPETYGKGTFQTFTLESTNFGKVNPKGEFKVTRGRYYTVSGKSPQLVGVQSDINVPGFLAYKEVGEKYSRFPLDTDCIPASFEDDLEDVPFYQRAHIAKLYKCHLQKVLSTYKPYLPLLKENSAYRQENNKNYKNFITEVSKKESDLEVLESFGQNDLQLLETLNIMKDLILLEKKEERKSA